jgi:hypothetical protein
LKRTKKRYDGCNTNIDLSHDMEATTRELPAGCAHSGTMADDFGVSLFLSFLFSFLRRSRMNQWMDVDESRGSMAHISRKIIACYVGTMCVIRVRVGVMEYCCFSLGRPTDDERCSVDVYHGCDTTAD